MSACPVIDCADARSHHHHVTAGFVMAGACHCSAADAPQSLPTIEQLLDFAAAYPGRHSGHVDAAIRSELSVTPARYFQLLGRAIATEDALRHDPVTTNRLRRLAEHRERDRVSRTIRL